MNWDAVKQTFAALMVPRVVSYPYFNFRKYTSWVWLLVGRQWKNMRVL